MTQRDLFDYLMWKPGVWGYLLFDTVTFWFWGAFRLVLMDAWTLPGKESVRLGGNFRNLCFLSLFPLATRELIEFEN